MSVHVMFACGGCDATAEVPLRAHWKSVFGGDLHRRVVDNVEAVAPDGWVAFDPYTLCCYCPECWAEIDRHEVAA